MRIHGDNITGYTIERAARKAGVGLYRNSLHGSRKRACAYDVILEGTGRTGTRYGQNNDMVAATWDEWGIFLAALFEADETLTIPRIYEDSEHFRWATAGRFAELTPAGQHVRHKWDHREVVTGAYRADRCACGALHRFVIRGTWADISGAEPAQPVAPPRTPAPARSDLGKYASNGRYAAELMGRIDALLTV